MSLFLPHSCCYLISMWCRVDNKKGQTAARRSLGRLWELAVIPGTWRCEDSECCSEGKRISLFNFLVLLFLIWLSLHITSDIMLPKTSHNNNSSNSNSNSNNKASHFQFLQLHTQINHTNINNSSSMTIGMISYRIPSATRFVSYLLIWFVHPFYWSCINFSSRRWGWNRIGLRNKERLSLALAHD